MSKKPERYTEVLQYLYEDFKELEKHLETNDVVSFGFFIGLESLDTKEKQTLLFSGGKVNTLLADVEALRHQIAKRSSGSSHLQESPTKSKNTTLH